MKNSFLKGAVILVIANFIVKFIGVIYKIPLGNLLSGDGMAYFTAAFDIYLLLLAFSTAGLPVAVSKMVSESYALRRFSEMEKIFNIALISFVSFGFLGSLLMFFGADAFANFIEIPLSALSIKALSPSVFFFSIIAIYRGYFQGMNNMNPTALTQILEGFSKFFIGIGITIVLVNLGYDAEILSAGAILGTTFSTLVAVILLILIYNSKTNRQKVLRNKNSNTTCRSSKQIFKDLIKIVVPITIGSLIVNLTGFLDLFLIMNRMIASGVSEQLAEFSYGSYKGYAYTIFNLPPSIITSVNISLIPLISGAYALGDFASLEKTINKSLKVIVLFTFPCAIGLMAIPGPILSMLYPSRPDEVAIATPLLAVLGFTVILTTLSSFTTIILQSTGKINLPIYSMLIGSVVKLILNYILIAIPTIAILGAPISTTICYLIILSINSYYIKKYTNCKIYLKESLMRPMIASLIMGVITILSYKLLILVPFLGASVSTFLTICISAVSYFFVSIQIKALTRADIDLVTKRNGA
ncbi:MAG: polysaccharide biosynthesis protein [Clostridia bacterium]